jgi:NAD(P)-dependent dehydrogenase (short-subunit alcohol dehydrogenase family)
LTVKLGSGMNRLAGKVALVTGAGRGYGRAIAMAYAKEGAKVIAADIERGDLQDLIRVITSEGRDVFPIIVDLSKPTDIRRMKDEVISKYGCLNILVNNAAVSPWKTLDETTVEDWDHTLDVNLRAYFVTCKFFHGKMAEGGGGSIINVSSMSGEEGTIGEIAYSPSKYGVEGLTQCLALELKKENIAVNSIVPLTSDTSSWPGKPMKYTSMSSREASTVRSQFADCDSLVEAFSEAWTFLGLQDGSKVTGQRFLSMSLAHALKEQGWEISANWRGKLTRAVYSPYDFPKSLRFLHRTANGIVEEHQTFDLPS